MLIMLPSMMKSQNATATISNATACSGDTILVPVNVTNFIDVGAMTIYIGYDTASAEFISLANINPVITGGVNVNANNGEVGVAYTNINGFSISNGNLFDLRYLLTATSTSLTFNAGTEIANTNLEVITLDTVNGGISTGLEIIDQPDSAQAYPDTDVTFTVIVTGNNVAYHWEQNAGSGWQSLQNNNTYSGVFTQTLTVHDVPLSFDGYTYRCLLTSGNCEQFSAIALLEVALAFPVATIGTVSSCPDEILLVPVFVGDFFDVIEFTFNITFDQNVLEFISLENIHPDLLPGTLTTTPLGNPPGISIHWESASPVSLTSASLFDMKFAYSGTNTSLSFANGTQVLNSLSNLINITLTSGNVYQSEIPVILTQPENQTFKKGEEGSFSVEATGVSTYQWQVSMDNGQNWSDLVNVAPYYNTSTAELIINPVTWNLNDYYYACLLTHDLCEIKSDAAALSVDTLTGTGIERNTFTGTVEISPNPVSSTATITFNSDGFSNADIYIFSLNGQMVSGFKSHDLSYGLNQEIVNLSGIAPGMYLLEVRLAGMVSTEILRAKLLKSEN
jgi:hypothetical protein